MELAGAGAPVSYRGSLLTAAFFCSNSGERHSGLLFRERDSFVFTFVYEQSSRATLHLGP